MNVEEEGEKLGKEVYAKIAKDYSPLSYAEFRLLVDHLYAGIYECVYDRTYRKDRGTEYWNDNDNKNE